jgi:PAS domain S-box-containing protein
VNISLERKIALGTAGAVLVLLAGSVTGWLNADRFRSAFRSVDHTHQVLGLLNGVVADELTVQTSTRGFLLTGSERMLAGYNSGGKSLGETLSQLRQLVADNAVQIRNLEMLQPAVADFRKVMADRVAARRTRGLGAAVDTESFLRGQSAVERVHAITDDMVAEENRLLRIRIAATLSAGHAELVTITAVSVFAALLVALAGLWVGRDLRLRRRAEDAQRVSEDRYRALFNAMDEGFCVIQMIFDAEGRPFDYRFLEINQSFEKQTGLSNAVGKTMRELAPLHEAHWYEKYGKIASTGEGIRFQERAEALHRWYDVYAFRFGSPEKRQVAILFNDISDRKRAEIALSERTAQLEVANDELEAFSYSVSHDLRAPLRHVDGFGGMLEVHAGPALDEKGRRYLTTIRDASTKMGRLIDDLLSFSRMGSAPIAAENVNSDELVASIIRDGRFDADGHTIIWEISPLPQVRADSAMLRQVWSNLIENAVKYSRGAAPPRITITHQAVGGDRPENVFCVRDNGAGFDPTYVKKLFGVFQRLHTAAEFEGTGIGLANVRRIVTRHGGRTWAEGEVGKGAAFYFTLPRA